MSTNDVPGAKAENHDVLAMGCWAEHEDGSLIFVESLEAGRVIYSVFDIGTVPPVEYRDAMAELIFKTRYSWPPTPGDDDIRWTWHDKTPFPWTRVMEDFPAGQRAVSAIQTMSAAQRVAESLHLRAESVRVREETKPTIQRAARQIMNGLADAVRSLRP